MNYTEAVNYIFNIPKFTKKTNLSNTERLLELLGNPGQDAKIIHVAGTNGKGSVCTYIASILEKAGFLVGLFTSPHLVEVNERIRINQNPVENEQFVQAFHKVLDAVSKLEQLGYSHPAFFEFLFAMGMVIFEQSSVEYIVLETGLGGRLDATNVVKKPIVSVITSISLDHTEILGGTIEEIAVEKAGIIKKDVPVVYFGQNPAVDRVIRTTAEHIGSLAYKIDENSCNITKITKKNIDFYPLYGYYGYDMFTVPFIARYQVYNAMLAIQCLELTGLNLDQGMLRDGIAGMHHEGRMEQVMDGVIFDGAHNDEGIKAFVETVRDYPVKGRRLLLFSAVQEKNYDAMIQKLAQDINFDKIIVTQIENARAVPSVLLADCFRKYTDQPVTECPDSGTALKEALLEKGTQDVLFCAGSLYLIGSLKEWIRRNIHD